MVLRTRSGATGLLTLVSRVGWRTIGRGTGRGQGTERPPDAAADALEVRAVPADRPELRLTDHDRSDRFDFKKPAPLSRSIAGQPKQGRIIGFDFARDPLNSDHPFMTLDEIMKTESSQRAMVMAAQRQLLASRYDLTPKLDPQVKMSRGKPVLVGPTARLPEGMTFEQLASLGPEEIRGAGSSPIRRCRIRSRPTAGRCSRRCRSRCSRGSSGSTSSSTCPTSSCPSSRRRSSCRTGRSWATSRAGRS